MLEPHEHTLAEMIDMTDSGKLDVELEHALQSLGAFRVARVGRDLAAALNCQRGARQIFTASRHFPQHFAFQRHLRVVHCSYTNTVGGETHLVDRFLRYHDAGKRIGFAYDIAEQIALAVVTPGHIDHLDRKSTRLNSSHL